MKLYYTPGSSNSRKPLLVIQHLGMRDVELQVINLQAGEQKQPWFLQLNPNGKVPVLTDGHFKLWESNAIMQYLAEKHGTTSLWPLEMQARCDVSRWLFWQALHWSPAADGLAWQRVLKPAFGGTPDPVEVQRCEENFNRLAAVLNQQLEGKMFLVNNQLTLADLAIGASLSYAQEAQIPYQEYANVRNWFARITALDAWKQTQPPKL